MASKHHTIAPTSLILFVSMAMLVGIARSDFTQDRTECANQVIGLAACLPYVGGTGKAPTPDCCSGLKKVLDKGKKCLCILIKDRNDPNLGLKINVTLAATLPEFCHAPANITDCINILHLPPNSEDAKVFAGFDNMTKGVNSTTPTTNGNSTETSANQKSNGGMSMRWFGMEMIWGCLLCVFISCIVI